MTLTSCPCAPDCCVELKCCCDDCCCCWYDCCTTWGALPGAPCWTTVNNNIQTMITTYHPLVPLYKTVSGNWLCIWFLIICVIGLLQILNVSKRDNKKRVLCVQFLVFLPEWRFQIKRLKTEKVVIVMFSWHLCKQMPEINKFSSKLRDYRRQRNKDVYWRWRSCNLG